MARLEETEEKEKCERVMTPGNSSTEESRNGKETAERSSSEDRGTLIEIEGEHGTDGEETDRQLLDGKGIRPGTQMLATHRYKKNPDGPVGNELDLSEGETLVYLMKHDDNDHWWLAENGKGQVGYVPAAYLMIIIDETLQEEDSDTTRKEGQGKGTDGTKIGGEMGQHGERRKTYSAAVIGGFKRNSTIYVGDYSSEDRYKIEQGGGRSSLFTGSKNRAFDGESRADHGKRIWRVHTSTRRDEQHGQGRNNSDS